MTLAPRITRVAAAFVAAAVALTLSACGGKDDASEPNTPPTNTQTEPTSEVPGQEVTVDDEGNEHLTITVGDQEFKFRQKDGEWTAKDYARLHAVILSSHGYFLTQLGEKNLTERWTNHKFADCSEAPKFANVCSYETAFGDYDDEVYTIDIAEADVCYVLLQFDGRFSFDSRFQVISTVEVPGPDESVWDITVDDRYGENPTWQELEAFGQDGLPCGGIAVP